MLRRIEWTAMAVCLAMAGLAFALTHGRWSAALAVLAGGVLAGVSYRMIVASAGALARAIAPGSIAGSGGAGEPPSRALAVLKLAGRYALLALLAYVMIARLRLHPLGLLAGASSVVAAVSIEAVRFLLQKKP